MALLSESMTQEVRALAALYVEHERARVAVAVVEAALNAVRGISDDYQTSEQHHPGHVLIPLAKFEQLQGADAALAAAPTIPATGEERHQRAGAHLFKKAREDGWKDDGEGAYEYMIRRAYEAGTRRVGHATTPAIPATGDARSMTKTLEEMIAEAIEEADNSFSYSFNLTRLVDGVETHTLTMPGFDPIDFEDRDDGYRLLNERRNALRAKAITAITPATGEGIPGDDCPCGYCGRDTCRCDATDLCQAPGCDNPTNEEICDSCNQWVTGQVASLDRPATGHAATEGEG